MVEAVTYAQALQKETQVASNVKLDDDYTSWDDIQSHIHNHCKRRNANGKSVAQEKQRYAKLDMILDENGTYLMEVMASIREAWAIQGYLNADGMKSFANIVARYIDLEEIPSSQDEHDHVCGAISDADDY